MTSVNSDSSMVAPGHLPQRHVCLSQLDIMDHQLLDDTFWEGRLIVLENKRCTSGRDLVSMWGGGHRAGGGASEALESVQMIRLTTVLPTNIFKQPQKALHSSWLKLDATSTSLVVRGASYIPPKL